MFKNKKIVIVSAIFSVVFSILFLSSMLINNNGHFSAPIDDSFIYFDYAKTLANTGEPFTYNEGDDFSTGSTSFIYPFLLALGFLIGFSGEYITIWVFIIQCICLFFFGIIIFHIVSSLIRKKFLHYLVTLLIFIHGNLLWGFFCQMEIALYTMMMYLVAWRYYKHLRENDNKSILYLSLSCVGFILARPDGFYFTCILIILLFVHRLFFLRKLDWENIKNHLILRKEWLYMLMPIIVMGLIVLTYYLLTGHTSSSGMRCKSHLYWPDYSIFKVLDSAAKSYYDMIFTHFSYDLFHPKINLEYGFFLLFAIGAVFCLARDIYRRRIDINVLLILWFIIGLAIQAFVLNVFWHKGRYYVNYFPIYYLYLSIGIMTVVNLFSFMKDKIRIKMAEIIIIFIILLLGWRTLIWINEYGHNCRSIYEQQVTMGKYLATNLDPKEPVAVNDAGAIKYYGNRFVYDLVGLCNEFFAKTTRAGQAAIYERIKSIPIEKRPFYFAIYQSWYKGLYKLNVLKEIHSVEVQNNTMCSDPIKYLYYFDWNAYLDADMYYEYHNYKESGYEIVDKINIADIADEKKHNYRYFNYMKKISEAPTELLDKHRYLHSNSYTHVNKDLIDAGRSIESAEEFIITNVKMNKNLTILMRTTDSMPKLAVFIDGKNVGELYKKINGSTWREVELIIPKEHIKKSVLNIRIEIIDKLTKKELPKPDRDPQSDKKSKNYSKKMNKLESIPIDNEKNNYQFGSNKYKVESNNKDKKYDSFYYWFLQKKD